MTNGKKRTDNIVQASLTSGGNSAFVIPSGFVRMRVDIFQMLHHRQFTN